MILVHGLVDEPVIKHFLAYLLAHERDFVLLDERQLGREVHLDMTVDASGLRGTLDFGHWSVELEALSGIYTRGGLPRELQEATGGRAAYGHRHAVLTTLLNLFPGPVANRPYACESNGAKPCQYDAILASGLRVPDTFIGARLEALEDFSQRHPRLIIKSTSGIRSIVKPISLQEVRERCPEGRLPPHQFQERLEGTNVRVHVVGDEVLACRAVTTALDYRYAALHGHTLSMEAVTLPEDISARCVALARALGLDFAGVDLLHAQGGEWFCFEVNPSPGYLWFEQHSGLPITSRLVDYLSQRNQQRSTTHG